MIGSAKDLIETIAKIILELSGDVAPSNAELPGLLTKAHVALDRQPGHGAAAEVPIRNIAQGAKSIASQLPELRNRFGTGHGRVLPPEIDEELAPLCVDAAMLWSRWALRRLGYLLAGRPTGLVTALQDGIFYRGDLAKRLQAINLETLEPSDQRLIGVSVAHRAMRDTFVVKDEGVEACAGQPDLRVWPSAYRVGLVEGLFLDREGYVDANAWGVKAAAAVIAAAPSAAQFLQDLATKVGESGWAYRFASDAAIREQTVVAMRDSAPVLPDASARDAWERIVRRLDPDPWFAPS
jgi:hypothetical protein